MASETFIAYWSGEEPTGSNHSPTLNQTPGYVDVVILFYVLIDSSGTLNFDRLVLHNNQAAIMSWMADIRQRQQNQSHKTLFTLGILSADFPQQDPSSFANTVAAAVEDWGVDGITIDYEPPSYASSIISVVQAIRNALPNSAIMTAPIYSSWLGNPELSPYTKVFDYINTMDYTPYPGYDSTISLFKQYQSAMGDDASKLGIGVSCMTFTNNNHTPLADVTKLTQYEPQNGNKLGIMLYTLSYDAPGHGSPYPEFTYAKTIHDALP